MNKILKFLLRNKEGVWAKAYLYEIKYNNKVDTLKKRTYLEELFPEI